MKAPSDRVHTTLEIFTYQIHKYTGMVALAVVVAHWIWSLTTRGSANVAHLFPYAPEQRARIIKEVRGMVAKKLPDSDTLGGVTGLVHGFGLLAVSALAVTGAGLFVWWPDLGKPDKFTLTLGDVHSALSNLVWAYWIGHGGIALLHHYLGHDSLRKMFWR